MKIDNALNNILDNIQYAEELSAGSNNLKIVAVVSGSATDRENWEARLESTKTRLFNRDGSTEIFSLREVLNNKTREGNFLGTLLAYRCLYTFCCQREIPYREGVILLGMIFGRGERMSPFTQIEGDRKPAIRVNAGTGSSDKEAESLTAIEEALFYFAPVGKYLEEAGFRGILDKWGDETEIPSISLRKPIENMENHDIIKFVSVLRITDELAEQKDWVLFDENNFVKAQLSRNKKAVLEKELSSLGISPDSDGNYYGGVSMGPVAVSYTVLDIAEQIFFPEIAEEGIFIDFDPYFIMAISMENDTKAWEKQVQADPGLKELVRKVPRFFEKCQAVKTRFQEITGRSMNIKICDLGSGAYWGDIGQHKAMRERFLSLLEDTPEGIVARRLEGLGQEKDPQGNIIVDSEIDPGIVVRNSVIIKSVLKGKGRVSGSVVKHSTLQDPDLTGSFAVLSHRTGGRTLLAEHSGIYHSLGSGDLILEKGMRSGTLLTEEGPMELTVSEDTNLRDRAGCYDVPIYSNPISFLEAYDRMLGCGMDELKARREALIRDIP